MDAKFINEQLLETFGRDLFYRPLFRLIWSQSLEEKRYGHFVDWYGHIVIREFDGVRLVKKYPKNIWGECWILEMLSREKPPSDIYNWDGYECAWSFTKRNSKGEDLINEPIEPSLRAVMFIANIARLSLEGQIPKTTLAELYDEEEKKWKKEHDDIRQMLGEEIDDKVMSRISEEEANRAMAASYKRAGLI